MEVELTAASVQRDVATIEAFKSKMLEEEEKQQVGFIRMFTYGDEVYAQELPPVLVNNIVSVMEDVANEMKLTLQQTAKLLNSVYSYLPQQSTLIFQRAWTTSPFRLDFSQQ